MKSLPRLFAALLLPLFILGVLAGCSNKNSGGTKTLSSIAVTPATPAHLKVGATQQFTATGTFSDGTTSDISSTVTWTSGTTATATISTTGLATGVAAGTSSITATSGTVTSTGVTLTVISLSSIAVTPNPAAVAVGGTKQFTATGTYSDASTADITTQVTWASVPTSAATIGAATGLATGVANGTSQITATLGTIVSPGVTLTVGTGGVPVPVAVKIVQLSPTIAVTGAEDFTAQFQMSDGSLVAPTAAVTWSSGTTATASIIATSGIAVGLAPGTSLITASSGALTPGTTTLTVVPAVTRFAYVSGQKDIATASYVVNSANSTLTSFGVLRDTLFPAQVVPEPSGRFAYAIGANATGTVGVYTVDPATGSLTATNTGFTAGQTTPGPAQAIIDPTGQFLYVLNSNTNNVTALHISGVDGSLSCLGTPAPAPPCTAYGGATLNFPLGFVEDRTGKYLYVSNNGGNNISGFSVGADGSLTPLSTPTFATGTGPGLPTIDPSNSFLYVPNNGDNTVSVFSIAPATGLLTALATSPFSTGVGGGPTMAAITPSNKFLYVTNGDGTISGITIGVGGALGAAVPGSPYTTGSAANFPYGLAVDVTGSFLVVVNNIDNTLAYFTINGTTGALTLTSTVETRTVPQLINLYAGIAAPTIGPATVEAANAGNGAGTGSVSSYTVNAGTGALTAAATSPTTTLDGNNQAYASTTGKFFYTASATGKKLDGFTVSSAAALTALPSNATNLSPAVPGGIYAEIGDQFVYVADTANAAAAVFNNDPTLGLTTNSTLSGLTSVNAIAGDAQGTLIYALGANQLVPAPIDQSSGGVSAGTVLAQAGNWTSGAVDPSARFLVAADSTGKQISSFSITPLGSGGTSGSLTATGSNTALGGSGNYSITFDPLGRFVFVADTTNGTVAVFSFNSSTGATTAVGAATNVSASGVTNIAVDANGKYLYVGTKGNGTTTAGTVAVYTIGSTGTLTAGTPANAAIGTSAVTVTNSVN
jgi:6-phosphogluconolactonase (cycloisomerase 2 family)